MKKYFFLSLISFILTFSLKAQITLTHNVGNTPIKTDWTSCQEDEYWGRTFTLSEFGISTTEQFIIRSGQIAISNSYAGAMLSISVLIIDDNFPNSEPTYIGGGYVIAPLIGDSPEIVDIKFNKAVVIPSGAKKILVTVEQYHDSYNPNYKKVVIAGTDQDNGVSWIKGCNNLYYYTPTENLSTPVPNANFFINVTGVKQSLINTDSNLLLSHNIGDDVLKTQMYSCNSGAHFWARKFILKDFNISKNEEFIINEGQIAFSEVGYQPNVKFNIYKIDKNFPTSFSESDLIGSSQAQSLNVFSKVGLTARIVLVDFETPITVPSDVEMILVEVQKGTDYGDAPSFIAGTKEDNDDSWYKGCGSSGVSYNYRKLNSY